MRETSTDRVQALRAQLLAHPIYRSLTSTERVRTFMEHHVFAVWDFMTVLKRLQRDLTCVELPWIPRGTAAHARLINEIVLDEESDEDGQGGHANHFELYLRAMREAGARTSNVERLLTALGAALPAEEALRSVDAPASVVRFVTHTLSLARHAATHEVCAAFFHGREDVIPMMFDALIRDLPGGHGARLRYYLERHVAVDGNNHGPAARGLLDDLCGGDSTRIAEAETAACAALTARIALWDGVMEALPADGDAMRWSASGRAR